MTTRTFALLALSIIIALSLVSGVHAAEFKLTASDGAADDQFGYSVAIAGDYALVGARFDDDKGVDSGSAYIFKRDGTSWNQQAKLTASDGAAGDRFGYSVAIAGEYALVGALYDDDKGVNSGSAYIFKRDGTSWNQQAKLTASDGAAGDQFGWSVAIAGDYALVGALYDADKGVNSGSAYIFKRDGISWNQQAKLTASDGAAGDQFGHSVAIAGEYALVGAHLDDDNGTDSGSAYIFKRDGTSWNQQAKLTASDGAAGDQFGYSVAIAGDYALVGARLDDDNGSASGSAYIYMLRGVEAPAVTLTGLVVLGGILSVIISRTIRRKR
jgi:nucleoside-specific outer membrane channel protein Tsx